MNIGRLHYIPSNSQLTLAGTGVKSQCPAPGFKARLHSVTIYIDNASVSSPSFAFKITKYVNGTAVDVTNPISVAASDLTTGKALVYYFDGVNPRSSKYVPVLSASADDLNAGEVFGFQVTTSSGITTLTGHIVWCLVEG